MEARRRPPAPPSYASPAPAARDLVGERRSRARGVSGCAWRRQHPVALQVAVGAVVADDLEGVGRGLERPARALAPVAAPAGPGGRAPARARRGVELGDPRADLGQPAAARGPQRVRQHAGLAVRVEVDEAHPRAGRARGRAAGSDGARASSAAVALAARAGSAPWATPRSGRSTRVRNAGMTLRSSRSIRRGALARLGQRVGAHAHQHRLVGLPRGEDADVGGRRGRQQAAQQVERPRPGRPGRGRRAASPGPRARARPTCSTIRGRSVARRRRRRRRASARRTGPSSRVRHDRRRPVVAVVAAGPVGVRRCSGWTARGSWPAAPTGAPCVSRFDAPSTAMWAPPSWATESSPYSASTRS